MANANVTISERIGVTGDVHLILCDNVTLTASKGIHVAGTNSLTIYAQSTGNNMGKLFATATVANCAGIGGGANETTGDGGTITINGGDVTATGNQGAGIGGGDKGAGGTITISGGNVTATGGSCGAGIGVTAPTAQQNLTYTGQALALVSAGSVDVANGARGSLQYAVSTEDSTTAPTDWAADVPTGTDAGDYYVWYRAADGEDYGDAVKVGSVTISKATPGYTTPSDLTATYGQTLADVTLPTDWAWADSSASVGNAGTQTFKANFTPTDADNYETVSNVDVTVTVNKANSSVTTEPTAKTDLTYNGSEQALVNAGTPSGGEMQYSTAQDGEYSTTIPTGTNAGS